MNYNIPWEWPVEGCCYCSFVSFLMASKLCKTLLFPEMGKSTGNRLWDDFVRTWAGKVCKCAGWLHPREKASHRLWGTFQMMSASMGRLRFAKLLLGRIVGFKMQLKRQWHILVKSRNSGARLWIQILTLMLLS